MNAKTRLVLKVTGLAVGLMALAGSPAFAHDAHLSAADGAQAPAAAAPAVFLAAELRGANEVPPADPDGRAVEVIRIQNNTVSFAAAWRNISSPQAGHIHMGAAGTNGPVVVPFFGGGPLPATFRAVTGQVTVADPTLLASIVANPENFYVNLHTADFPAGAVRAQLRKLSHPVDLIRFLRVGSLLSVETGDQEAAGGDPKGHATGFFGAHGTTVTFGYSYAGIAPPTLAHIHQAPVGTSGPVVVPFFAAPMGLPASLTGVAGVVMMVDPMLVRQIRFNSGGFYANLHTPQFPAGAVRGQLMRTGFDFDRDDAAAAADSPETLADQSADNL